MDLGSLVLRLEADNTHLQRRLAETERMAGETGRRASASFADSFTQGLGQAIGGRAVDLGLKTLGTIPNFVKDSLKVYEDFSRSINQSGVFSNATKEQLTALSDEAKRLGATTSKSAVDVSRISVELIKAGFSAEETKNALNGVVAAAEATSEEVDISGRIIQAALANFSNEFGKTREDIDKLADLFSTVGNAGNLTFQGIKQGLGTAGGTARAFNQTLADTLKVLGLLIDTGSSNEVSATAYKNILLRLGTPDEKGSKVLEQLKINVRDSKQELRSVFELIPEFQRAFASLDPKSRGQFAKDLFGTDTVSPFLALLNATPDKIAAYSRVDVEKAAGSANINKSRLQQGLSGATESFSGSVDTLKINFAESFAPSYEQGLRFFQSIIDNIASSKTLFTELTNTSKSFTELLEKNPKLALELATVLEGAAKQGLDTLSLLARDVFEYLSKNPSAIEDTIVAVDSLARSFASLTSVVVQYISLLGRAGSLFRAASSPNKDFGIEDKDFKQRFELLRDKNLVQADRNFLSGFNGNEQLTQDALVALQDEIRKYGSPLKISKEQLEQRAIEIGDKLPLSKRFNVNPDDLLKQAYEQLRTEQGNLLLKLAAKKPSEQQEKKEQPQKKEQPKLLDTKPISSPQKVETAAKEVEDRTQSALDAIARAELERQLAIEKLVTAGVITYEQAEVRKLESTRLRIEQELKLEQNKLAKKQFKEGETPDQVKSGIASKTIELLKIQQQIEATSREEILLKLQRQTQLEQQKLGLTNQAIALERQKLTIYDDQLNQLGLMEDSINRQQRLRTAENNLQTSILNADIERSNLRLDRLNQARDIFQRLQGDISQDQRQVLTAELGRLGLQGRTDEKSILDAINAEERAQFRLKAEALNKQQEIERQSLDFEREKTQLQIQQNNLAAERQVKEAEFNLVQSQIDNQSRALDAEAKVKEAEIKANNTKNKEEKQTALELVSLYKQRLELINTQGNLLESNGQSAVNIAKQNQQSIAQEAQVSRKELEIKRNQLEVNQKLEKDKLDAESNNSLSRQRIAVSDLNNNKPEQSNNNTSNRSASVSKIHNGRVTLSDGTTLSKDESNAFLNQNTSITSSIKSVNVSPFSNSSLFNNLPSGNNRTNSLSIVDPNSPFFTNTPTGKFFDKLLTSPLDKPIDQPSLIPKVKEVNPSVFQDAMIQKIDVIIGMLQDTTPIIQSNDYTLHANNETELLQKARNQSINDLVQIVKNLKGVNRG